MRLISAPILCGQRKLRLHCPVAAREEGTRKGLNVDATHVLPVFKTKIFDGFAIPLRASVGFFLSGLLSALSGFVCSTAILPTAARQYWVRGYATQSSARVHLSHSVPLHSTRIAVRQVVVPCSSCTDPRSTCMYLCLHDVNKYLASEIFGTDGCTRGTAACMCHLRSFQITFHVVFIP